MKKLVILLVLLMMALAACGPDPYSQQTMDPSGQPMAQGGGMSAGQGAALGAVGGFLAGKMMSRPAAAPMAAAPQVIHQKTIVHHYAPARPTYHSSSYRPRYRPSSGGFRPSGGFRSGRR